MKREMEITPVASWDSYLDQVRKTRWVYKLNFWPSIKHWEGYWGFYYGDWQIRYSSSWANHAELIANKAKETNKGLQDKVSMITNQLKQFLSKTWVKDKRGRAGTLQKEKDKKTRSKDPQGKEVLVHVSLLQTGLQSIPRGPKGYPPQGQETQ